MACVQVLQGNATWLPFIAANVNTGDPRTGIIFSQVDVSFKKSNQVSFGVKVLTAPEFRENGNGVYEILFSTTDLDTEGSFLYVVNGNGSLATPAIRQFVGHAYVQTQANYTPGTIAISTNTLTGNIIDLHGSAVQNAAVCARIVAMPTVLGTSPNIGGVSTELVSARTDAGGFFALELVHNAVVDITIPEINYRRTLTVPTNATDELFTLA